MELIIEDKEGRILGSRDLEGSRWEQVGNHFENVQDVAVTITSSGLFGEMYIKVGNERITSDGVSGLPHRLDVGGSIIMAVGKLKLSWHEQHTQVWGDTARDHGVPGSQIEFSRGAAERLRHVADDLAKMLNDSSAIDPKAVQGATWDLLAAVDDLLAAIKVAGTPV